jgi:radical SAM protein with 4Fe4S-binding SPASM domain
MNNPLLPGTIIVEMTNDCNLNCPLCSTSRAMKRQRGYMSFVTYMKLIDELGSFNQSFEIAFTMCGEPLLHAEACRFINYASKNNMRTSLSTNVTRLKGQLQEDIICSSLGSISLCLDGFSKKSHEAYRTGSNFDQIKNQCEELIACRNKKNKGSPEIIIQTLITSLNEHELNTIEAWAEKTGAEGLYLKTLSLGTHLTEEQKEPYKYLLPKNKKYRRAAIEDNAICTRPDQQTIIYWNGDVGLCCIDFNNDFKLGNINDESLKTIIESEYARLIRRKGRYTEHELCRRCQARSKPPGFRRRFIR